MITIISEVKMRKLAVCGKGGSGKSVITRLLASSLVSHGYQVLVVDSDESNTGLFRMLGFQEPPDPLIYLLGGKQKLEEEIESRIRSGESEMSLELIRQSMVLGDIPPEYITELNGIKLVVVGKIMMSLEGCACPMGIVTRSFLKKLELGKNEVAVVDLEAGVEHFGRGVETGIDGVLVVVEPSIDSLDVAQRINEMATSIQIGDVWVVLNKIPSDEVGLRLKDYLETRQIGVIGTIHQDEEIFLSCLEGRPINAPAATEEMSQIINNLFS
jgi:CO dehydrogenase maturation factor